MFQVKFQGRKLIGSWGEGWARVRGVSMKIRHEMSSPNDLSSGVEEGGLCSKAIRRQIGRSIILSEFGERGSQLFRHMVISPQKHPQTLVVSNLHAWLLLVVTFGRLSRR
jgi:hypothetical protein